MLTAETSLAPQLAKMVINTCSFKLKGPGFNENDHFVKATCICFDGRVAAISFPIGRTIICAEIDPTCR